MLASPAPAPAPAPGFSETQVPNVWWRTSEHSVYNLSSSK